MFQIKNNVITISRGEDAVYSRIIKRNDKYKSPYIISNGLINPRIRMTIKANKNDKEPILNYEFEIGDEVPRFSTQEITEIVADAMGDITYPATPENVVYRIKLFDDYGRPKYEYHYYDGTEWKNYNIKLNVVITSDDTATLTPGTYYYDIALITRDAEDKIEYSEEWLTPTEFIIGGSFGE